MAKIALFNPSLRLKTFWLKRVLYELEDHSLRLYTSHSEAGFKEQHPVVEYSQFPLNILKYLKDKHSIGWLEDVLLRDLRKHKSEIILFNFLSYANQFRKIIDAYQGKVLVHIHGKDVCWDFIDPKTGKPYYSNTYISEVKEIESKVYYIANSEFTRKKLLDIGVSSERIFLKYFGFPVSENVNPERRLNDSMRVLFLGRLVDVKNPMLVLTEFIEARKQGFKGQLIIAGTGDLLDECKQIALSSDYSEDISFKGWVTHQEAMQLYRTCHILAMPNKKGEVTNQEEAFGLSYIEAMSHGLPAIGGNSGGVPEIIDHETNGFIVSGGVSGEMAEIFLQLQNDPALLARLGVNARETVRRKFSTTREKKVMNSIIDQILSR